MFEIDQNGFVDFKEFMLAMDVIVGGTPKEKVKWAFKLHDVDGNGIIDPSETFEVVKAIHAMSSTDPTEEEKVIVQQLTGLPSSDQSELIADRFAEISMNPSILKTLIFHTQVLSLFEPRQVYEKIRRMKK